MVKITNQIHPELTQCNFSVAGQLTISQALLGLTIEHLIIDQMLGKHLSQLCQKNPTIITALKGVSANTVSF